MIMAYADEFNEYDSVDMVIINYSDLMVDYNGLYI